MSTVKEIKPTTYQPRFSRATLGKAVALACLSITSAPVLADSCVGASTTISGATVGNRCELGASESVTVDAPGSLTGASHGVSVLAAGAGSIDNAGTISGGQGIGIGPGYTLTGGITNSGTISDTGSTAGILVIGGGAAVGGNITNSGTISGGNYGIAVVTNANVAGTIINNSGGSITGSNYGVIVSSDATVGGITNNASITGTNFGIYLGMTSTITNNASGTVTGGTAAITALANGSIVINNSGLLDGAVLLENNTLNLDGTTGRITGLVTGAAGSTINVNGTFTTENDFTNTGATTFSIQSGGRLNLDDTANITTATLTNAGTLSVADGDGATITGDYTQAVGGVFEFGASDLLSYGNLAVTGTADLTASGALSVNVGAGDTLAVGNVLTSVLTAATLNAGALTVTDNSAIWNFSAAVNGGGTGIDITTLQELTVIDAVTSTGSSASTGVASVLDNFISGTPAPTGDMTTVVNALNTLTTEQSVANAAVQLTPSNSGVALTMLNLQQMGGSQVVSKRIAQMSGASSGDVAPDRYLWAQPFGGWMTQDTRGGVYGYDSNTTGLAIGTDAKVNNHWRLGGAVSYARTDVGDNTPVLSNSLDIETYQATIYASGTVLGDKTLNLQASLGTNDNDSERRIFFGGLNRKAKADFDSWQTQLVAEMVYGPIGMNTKTALTPVVGIEYSYVTVDGYTEKGAGAANLDVDSSSEDSLVLSIGGRLAHQLNGDTTLTAHLDVGHDFMADQSSVNSSFTGGGAIFRTEGIEPASTVLNAGVGMTMLKKDNLEISANYDIEARSDYDNQSASVKLRWQF
jgi:outer membrane autotransporter protein